MAERFFLPLPFGERVGERACLCHASRPPLTPSKGRGRNPRTFQSRTRIGATSNS